MSSKGELRFDNRVVVITGAGVGLGRAYALYYATKGAKIVVNDLGTSHTGTGTGSNAADSVVAEIKALGGVAVANYDSVEFGEKIVKTAIDNFGRIDILINNAGILRDKAFKNMSKDDWDMIIKVHLNGVFAASKAAYPYMLQQKFGRIINVSSPAGLYGAFGQVNYSCAKSGIVGFSYSLAKEGQKHNILCNVIAPVAATRMTETVLSKDILDKLKVDYIVPVVVYLTHECNEETGSVFELGGRWVSKVRWQRSQGEFFSGKFTPEEVRDRFNNVTNFEKGELSYPTDTTSGISTMVAAEERTLTGNKTADKVLKSDAIFNLIKNFLGGDEGKALVSKIGAVFQFDITEKKGGEVVKSYKIDLKNGNGSCKEGPAEKYDALFTMTDADFEQVCLGKLNPQMAFIQGKMKIKGSMGKASKFTPELFPKPTPENIAKYSKAKF
jgi:3-hydroxyacyl-CoA dehydrogenase/3a,7a,12a-trihydroxy-5b-cholest-24-enoyl-CoA hydratase